MKNSFNNPDYLDESREQLRPDAHEMGKQPEGVSDAEKAQEHIQQKHKAEQLLHHAETKEAAEKTINEHKQSLNELKQSKSHHPSSYTTHNNGHQPRTENISRDISLYPDAATGKQAAQAKVQHEVHAMQEFFGLRKAA